MNVDLTQEDIKLIVSQVSADDPANHKLIGKLTRLVIPDIDEAEIAKKWQEWQKNE
jgi:hypothetical protein